MADGGESEPKKEEPVTSEEKKEEEVKAEVKKEEEAGDSKKRPAEDDGEDEKPLIAAKKPKLEDSDDDVPLGAPRTPHPSTTLAAVNFSSAIAGVGRVKPARESRPWPNHCQLCENLTRCPFPPSPPLASSASRHANPQARSCQRMRPLWRSLPRSQWIVTAMMTCPSVPTQSPISPHPFSPSPSCSPLPLQMDSHLLKSDTSPTSDFSRSLLPADQCDLSLWCPPCPPAPLSSSSFANLYLPPSLPPTFKALCSYSYARKSQAS